MKIPLYRHYFNFEPRLNKNEFKIRIKNLSPFSLYNKSIQIGEEIFTTNRLIFNSDAFESIYRGQNKVKAWIVLESSIWPRSKINDESIIKTFLEQNDDIIFKELIMPFHDTLKELGFENWNNTPNKYKYEIPKPETTSLFFKLTSSHEAYDEVMKFWKPFYRMKTISDTD